MSNHKNMTINVNGISIDVNSNNDRIELKPITEDSYFKNYKFGMNKNNSIEYFLEKLDDVSKNITLNNIKCPVVEALGEFMEYIKKQPFYENMNKKELEFILANIIATYRTKQDFV